MRGLQGKVIVVCAGGTGDGSKLGPSIGGSTARRLAEEGAHVVVGDLDAAAAERTAQLIADAGGAAVAAPYDAADEVSTKALMDRAVAEYGRIDGVHFNAMDTSPETSRTDGEHDLLTVPLEIWHKRHDVGLLGFLLAARHSIPHMLEAGGGGIVGTTSDTVYIGEPRRIAYASAKAGMGAIVRHIASRWGREGIRANAVSPGLVPSEQMLAEPRLQDLFKLPRSPRFGTGEDIGAAVAFLLSDDGQWINGQALCVDGGEVMRP